MSKPSRRRTSPLKAESTFVEPPVHGEFPRGRVSIHAALEDLARRLDELHVPYAVVGAMALNAFGYRRATVDVDVLITPDGLARFKEAWLGRGYVERFAGSHGVRDAAHGVPIDFLLAGLPRRRKPKPVRFPDPPRKRSTSKVCRSCPWNGSSS